MKSAGSQNAFHFSATKSLGERYLSGFSEGLGGFGQSPTCRGALGRPSSPEQAQRPRGGGAPCAPDSPLLGCGDSVETEVWPMSGVAGPGLAITRLLWSFGHGSARRQVSKRSFPGLCGAARRNPSPSPPRGSPARPAAAGEADPAQRMPVIPLCRLAGVRGHGGGGRGEGAGEGRGGNGCRGLSSGEGRGPSGPAAPAGAVRPAPPQGSREFRRLPLHLKGSMSNDPLGL